MDQMLSVMRRRYRMMCIFNLCGGYDCDATAIRLRRDSRATFMQLQFDTWMLRKIEKRSNRSRAAVAMNKALRGDANTARWL